MKRLHRIIGLVHDSPTYGRDRVNLISGTTIGLTSLVLNGVIMCFVLPLLLDPDDSDFRAMTENVGFGQLLALILLGGATICATIAIPLRLITVFWGPRTGRYFDQIVLSGISPLRFVIGKVFSQNLFLLLILFLLLPWLVMSLTLGGVHPGVFLAGLFLVWLYCMALALLTLWTALYLNELLASATVIFGGLLVVFLGLIPMSFNPFVMTPVPALIHPVVSTMPSVAGTIPEHYITVFASCAVCLTGICVVSVVAVYLGPLYGIITENSTFGEVVRKGDSKKKRRFRMRLHIQRPSEIAFFYQNRGDTLRPHEGLIRWGAGFLFLLLTMLLIDSALLTMVPTQLASRGVTGSQWWIDEFHTLNLTVLGFALAGAVLLFSHARNTVYQRQPFLFGWSAEVARLDSVFFLLFLVLSTSVTIALPFYADATWMEPAGGTMFPSVLHDYRDLPTDWVRVTCEGSLMLAVAGLTICVMHRTLCLNMWVREGSAVIVGALYFFLICLLPLLVMVLLMEFPELRHARVLGMDVTDTVAPVVGMMSPMTCMMVLFNEAGGDFPKTATTIPFYVLHGTLIVGAAAAMKQLERSVRQTYFADTVETSSGEKAE